MGEQPGPDKLDIKESNESKSSASASKALISDVQSVSGTSKNKADERQGKLIEHSLQYPVLNAVTARAAYYGVQGRLFPNMDQIRSAMLDSGPIGQAAVNRMDNLSKKGWTFGALGPSDSLITRHIGSSDLSSLPKRLGMSLLLGGYNDSVAGRVTHNAFTSFGHTVVGFSNGADKDAANKYIHELAHGKSSAAYEKFESTPAAKQALKDLPEAQRLAHGKAMIEEELRALFAQVAANKRSTRPVAEFLAPHSAGIVNIPPEQAIKQGDLGKMVKDIWPYDGPKSFSAQDANRIANDYIKNTYGQLFVEGGKLNPAAEAAVAKEIAQLQIKAPSNPSTLEATSHLSTSTFSPKYANYLSRGAQSLGSLGLAVTVSDIRNQYSQGLAPGTGRLLSVGTDWAGFELGLAAGTGLGKATTSMLLKINPKFAMIAAPLSALGSGLVSTHYTHELLSTKVEKKTADAISKLLD